MKVRIVVSSNGNGSDEREIFTDDFDAPVSDLVTAGLTVDEDEVVEVNLPSGFPINYDLKRM